MTTPISVFLIDNHALTRAAIRSLLAESIKVVGQAGSSQETLAKLATMNTLPDIFLLDLSLPDSHGLILFQKICQHSQQRCRIIILTGETHPTFRQRCIRSGAADFLTKNLLTAKKLRQAIHRAMAITPRYYPRLNARSLPHNPAHSPLAAKIASLSDLQLVVLMAIAEGKQRHHLPELLGFSPPYIKKHYFTMRRKLDIKTDMAAAHIAIVTGLIAPRYVQTKQLENGDGGLERIHDDWK